MAVIRAKDQVVDGLAGRPLAVTTLGANDALFGRRLRRTLEAGQDELFPWGIGTPVGRGSVVALYVPKNAELGEEDQQRIRHLYVAASKARCIKNGPEFRFSSLVLLYRRLTLPTPLRRSDMCDYGGALRGPARMSFRNAGHARVPHPNNTGFYRDFWTLLLDLNPRIGPMLENRLGPPDGSSTDDIALSYATEDLPITQVLYDALATTTDHDAGGLRVFYTTTAWDTRNITGATAGLVALLEQVFGTVRVGIPLLSHAYVRKPWPLLELSFMCEHADSLLPLSLDGTPLADVDDAQVDLHDGTLPDVEHVSEKLTGIAAKARALHERHPPMELTHRTVPHVVRAIRDAAVTPRERRTARTARNTGTAGKPGSHALDRHISTAQR